MTARSDALSAVKAAIKAADPELFVREKVKLRGSRLVAGPASFELPRFGRIFVVGGGKAGLGMSRGMEQVLGQRITDGIVIIPDYVPVKARPRFISLHPATHPIPSEKGVLGVKKMLRLLDKPGPRDLVICLLSGGASALMPLPVPGVSLRNKQETTRILLRSGARIRELNTVRKHLSGIKGGRLAEKLYPATILSLIISDVPGDKPEDIGSGPTSPDTSTYADAQKILKKYNAWNTIPKPIRDTLTKGKARLIPETPKPGSRTFQRVHNLIVGNNSKPCFEAARTLNRKGYRTQILTRQVEGEARQIGRVFANILCDLDLGRFSLSRPVGLVAAGETTVTVKGKGIGGRNQELVLAAALGIQELREVAVVSVGTDGFDGPTNAAGAIADGTTVRRALARGLEPEDSLNDNDAYGFFKKLKDLVITGPSGTNVGDITIALAGPII